VTASLDYRRTGSRHGNTHYIHEGAIPKRRRQLAI
jgi:hypothetical protein